MAYGERLRELRAERQLSLRQVEERGGPNKDTMSLIERGVHKPHAQTLGRIAKAFGLSVADLRAELEAAESPLVQAPLSQEKLFENGVLEERLIERPQVREWLQEHGHMSGEEFLDWARSLGSDTDDEEEIRQAIEDGIQELLLKRDGILRALRTSEARKALFPAPPGLSKEEIKRWLLKPPGRWELVNEVRREYSARELALTNYSQQLFAEGKSPGYLSRRQDAERHRKLLERRRILEESYARAVA